MIHEITCHSQKELEGLNWTANIVDLGVSLFAMCALNELTTAFIMLRERKDIYNREIKHLANLAIMAETRKHAQMMSTMHHRKWFAEYLDNVIDLAEQDITLFRVGLKQTLDDYKVRDSELFAYMVTARALLDAATNQYKGVMETSLKDYGRDYSRSFSEFNCADVFSAWSKVCDKVCKGTQDIDLNTERNVALFRKIEQSFGQGNYIRGCLQNAVDAYPQLKEVLDKIKNNGTNDTDTSDAGID